MCSKHARIIQDNIALYSPLLETLVDTDDKKKFLTILMINRYANNSF